MASRRLDFNPAGGYLNELRARGLLRSSSPGGGVATSAPGGEPQHLPLGKVLRAASPEPRSLSEVQQSAGVEAKDFIAAVNCLSDHELVRIVDSDRGPELELTPNGEATLEA